MVVDDGDVVATVGFPDPGQHEGAGRTEYLSVKSDFRIHTSQGTDDFRQERMPPRSCHKSITYDSCFSMPANMRAWLKARNKSLPAQETGKRLKAFEIKVNVNPAIGMKKQVSDGVGTLYVVREAVINVEQVRVLFFNKNSAVGVSP